MLTRRQIKLNDRSARAIRRTVALHPLRNEQQSWNLHPNAGRASPQQAPTQHLGAASSGRPPEHIRDTPPAKLWQLGQDAQQPVTSVLSVNARACVVELTHGFNRAPASIDEQTVIRLNRDTLYSFAVVNVAAGARLTLPDAQAATCRP
jgi:hypothetical protein